MSNKNTKTNAIIITVLLITSVMLMTMSIQPIQAAPAAKQPYTGPLKAGDTATVTVPTATSLSFGPNPIGVNQIFIVNMWISPSPLNNKLFSDLKVTITKPDGTKDEIVMNSYIADATAWFEYSADQVGEWKLKFEFPGMYFPTGWYAAAAGHMTVYDKQIDVPVPAPYKSWDELSASDGARFFPIYATSFYCKPSSTAEQTLIVQEETVYSWPPSSLPSDYWTRPIAIEHREWWPILGNYPDTGYVGGGPVWDQLYPDTNPYWSDRYSFIPWVQGPNSAHIVWKRQGDIAGIIGGPAEQGPMLGDVGNPSVVYAGRCYQTYNKPGVGSVAACYDLRTGEVYYEIPIAAGGVTPDIASYVYPLEVSSREAIIGSVAQYDFWSVELLSIGGGQLKKVDPWTGVVSNYSIAPLTTGTYYRNAVGDKSGPCVLTVQNLGNNVPVGQRYRLINWTTAGTSSNFTTRIISNTSYARSSLPSVIDYNANKGAAAAWVTDGITHQTSVQIWDLLTGESTYNITANAYMFSSSASVSDHGKFAVCMIMDTVTGTKEAYFMAWDLTTGKLAWESESMEYPWGPWGGYSIQSAYGMIFWDSYDGIYAFDWDTGKIVWHYRSPARAAFEGPYYSEEGQQMYPFRCDSVIADGKVYAWNIEHTESAPFARGWSGYCLNVTTGELIWRLMLSGDTGFGAIADGYITFACDKDGYMYVVGKGKSATTVTAPDVVVSKGSGVVIKGSVLDMSPAQSGTPCVSKESMATQMEYLHKQMPIDGLWHNETITGVPVTLTAISSNGTFIDIGIATTDGYGGSFGMAWAPPNEGTYTITAAFAGDDSYGSSMSTTAVSVGPAPATTPPAEIQTPVDNTMTIIGVAIAMIIVVAIVGLLIFLALRKR